MPSRTKEWLQEYEARRLSSRAKPQQVICDEPVATEAREAENSTRVSVSVTSFRCRLIDPDNLCPKYFIDCLRYAEFIRDDSPDQIAVETKQVKVAIKADERTEITITPL